MVRCFCLWFGRLLDGAVFLSVVREVLYLGWGLSFRRFLDARAMHAS